MRRIFSQNFYFQEVFSHRIYSAELFLRVKLFSRTFSVSDMVSEISFLSQVRILFSQSSLKMNSDLVFTHFWSGFSFFFIHSKSWSLFRSVIFDAISHNGKSICEGRAKLDKKFNFDRTKQIAFSDC